MKLDKLKILGFKSFADEVELAFQPGLTAIVGPNGCGKSNISDAIRWVLGEQNVRFLRGKDMGDVIFNGTASRKSSGMVEIILEMSNLGSLPLDYSQIEITRRLYRSGESEYLLNKKLCRLKDITDLFLEWGVNKRAYTIVEQGNIDFIINAKPQERRILIETAAGILKYKERKREAIQKMELAKGNLERLHDIKNEVETQRISLQMQSRRARVYKSLCEQSEEKEKRFLLLRHKILLFHLNRVQSDYQRLLDQEKGVLVRLMSQESELEKVRLESMQLGSDFEVLQKELWEKEAEKRHMERRSESLLQEKGLREETLIRLKKEKNDLQVKQSDNQECLHTLQSQFIQLKEEISSRERNQKKIEGERKQIQMEFHEIRDRLEKKKKELATLQTGMSLLQNNLLHLGTKESELRKSISGKANAEREIEKDEARIKDDLACNLRKREVLSAQIKAARQICQKIETEGESDSRLLQELSERLEKQHEICAKLRHKKEYLEELEQKMEGFRSAVQHLLKKFSNRKAIVHILGTEQRYEPALEALLREDLQDILIESQEEALEMIKELKSHGKGKATFIPVSISETDKAREIAPQIKTHPGFIGRMVELVHFPQEYRNLLNWFLGDVLVFEDIETIINMESTLRGHWIFVTLDGDIIRPEGILNGGGTESTPERILNRKREIREIEGKLIQEGSEFERLLRDKEHLTFHKSDIDRKISEIKEEIFKYEHKISDLDRDQRYLELGKNTLETRKKKVNQERKQLENDLIKIKRSISEENEKEGNLLKKMKEFEIQKQTLEEKWHIHQGKQNVINQTYMEEEIVLASFRERISALDREKRVFEESNKEKEKNFIRVSKEIEGISKRITLIEQEILDLNKNIPGFGKRLIESQENLEKVRFLFNQVKEKGINLEENLKSIRYEHEQIRKELKSKEIEVAEWRTRLDDLQQDFSFTPQVENHSQEEIILFESELEDLKGQLEKLKNKIQKFGPVNLAAIEEFQKVDERYQFLNQQTSDLHLALESLRSIIRQINETSRELFHDAFYKINKEFQQIFEQLFKGGQAQLLMEEGLDCLEAGILIIAQPPGKRLQRLDLLSGGEKALTALAFIMAAYQLKPSPFCILDEVDAPLDEANVDRFINLLREMKERTQFIIITHCKRTMMNVDSIYGITMETPGVSKVVSVRMDQAQDFYSSILPTDRKYLENVQ